MKVSDYQLGFIGFGHLAQGICRAIELSHLIPRSQMRFLQRDPEKMKKNEQEYGITSTSMRNLVEKSDLLLLCVRPAQADLALRQLAEVWRGRDKMVISVMAGIQLPFFQKHLGPDVQILRAMPNIASSVGEGMTAFAFGPDPTPEFRSLSQAIFSSMGHVVEVPEEAMDISIGIAASGLGFVFCLIEAMARAGEKNGLSYPKALKMAAQTFVGAGKIILKGALPEHLIPQVATPHGTTEAGLKVLRSNEIEKRLQQVVEAAAQRSKEISEEYR